LEKPTPELVARVVAVYGGVDAMRMIEFVAPEFPAMK
jgi:hypothetical protein